MKQFWLGLLVAAAVPAFGQFVHTNGKQIVSATGQPVLLRGINLGNWFVPEGYMWHFDNGPQSPREIEAFVNEMIGPDAAKQFWRQWRERYVTADDISFIAANGFNSIRVPIHYKFFKEGGEGFALLDKLVSWAKASNVMLVLDMHAAPAGQTGTNIDDSWGYPWLFESPAAQDETIAIWTRIAKHYANEPAIIGYDLLNEPIPTYPKDAQYNPSLEPLYKRLVAAIRRVDPNHIMILGGAQWDSNFSVFGAPFDKNTVYTFHKYWTATDQSVIQDYLKFRDKYNVPIWLGESGENKDEWISAFVQTLEKNNVGWCFWPYKKMDATSSVVSFGRPTYWDEIRAYAKLPGGLGAAESHLAARPSLEHSRAAFIDLLEKIQLSNNRINDGYVKALGLHPQQTTRSIRKAKRMPIHQ